VAINVLDANATSYIGVAQSEATLQLFNDGQYVDYTLKAVSADDSGKSSTFSLVDENLCDMILHREELTGRLRITIDGEQHTGIIEHHAHEHEGHASQRQDNGHDHEAHDEGDEPVGHDHEEETSHADDLEYPH
jgi:hypothetical protein